jgi:hypothetical protein
MAKATRSRKHPAGKPSRTATAEAPNAELTDYEAGVVEEIAAWKATHPNVLSELFRLVAQPVARAFEQVIPDAAARKAIEAGYAAAERAADPEDIVRQAGVADLGELLHRPLEECDRLARKVGGAARGLGTVEGALTGAGGVFTTMLDIPLLFGLALRTIIKVGHCYGFPLDRPTNRAFVLGVLAAALTDSRERKQRILARLREIEDLLLEETQENLVVEEAASLLFQLEVFEEVPGVGAISGAVLNHSAIHRVERTARHVFQERWLRENGKVDEIAPAADAVAIPSTAHWSHVLARGLYAGSYSLGFALALPGLLWRRPEPQLAAS